jgi:hypothetical protein
MNWIERMYDLKGKDLYSQNGEGLYLEYIFNCCLPGWIKNSVMFDFGGGDGFYLSNSRHLRNLGMNVFVFDRENGFEITVENCLNVTDILFPTVISIDIDGNDYWVLQKQLTFYKPPFIIAEFNAAFTDSRTIKYNPDHVWDGTDYYGFSFEAGVKLAEANGYKVIFQIADMNMIMVRHDLINVSIPPVTFNQTTFFKKSERTDWEFI